MTSYLPAPIVQAHLEKKSWPWIISSVLVSFCPWGRLSNFCRVLTMRPQMPGKLLKKRPAAHSTVPRKPLRADVTPGAATGTVMPLPAAPRTLAQAPRTPFRHSRHAGPRKPRMQDNEDVIFFPIHVQKTPSGRVQGPQVSNLQLRL